MKKLIALVRDMNVKKEKAVVFDKRMRFDNFSSILDFEFCELLESFCDDSITKQLLYKLLHNELKNSRLSVAINQQSRKVLFRSISRYKK